jgi:hypothetical protein
MGQVSNVHRRIVPAPVSAVGPVLDTLSSREDRVWPDDWPPVRYDRRLGIGAIGGHGPVGYMVVGYDPGRSVLADFTAPRGIQGHHEFTVEPDGPDRSVLQHSLIARTTWPATVTWPLFFRPLHDALIEESLDKVERQFGAGPEHPHRRSPWVRLLRAIAAAPRRRS